MAKRKSATTAHEVSAPPAEYTVVARRYRPQQFAELIGQESVAKALANAIASSRVAHAYLFTGARGVGKTSAARILAKALNCVKGSTATPCDQCESCVAIAAGSDVDVLEIDGASNRRIEEVRDIRQNVQFRPTRGRYKIYIIDEVHMLTKEAFNALLKTLEEPPPHVKFIFATTDVQKVPITILSRCQRFDFPGISGIQIVDRLRSIARDEGVEADDAALEVLARRAAGSMRDAQSLLDQLISFGGNRLTTEGVNSVLGTGSDEQIAAIAAAILSKDVQGAWTLLANGIERGIQIGELFDQLIEYWRDLMLIACSGESVSGLTVSPSSRPALLRQAGEITVDTILAGLDILNSAKARLRTTAHTRVIAEMTIVRLARIEELVSLSELAHAIDEERDPTPADQGSGGRRQVIEPVHSPVSDQSAQTKKKPNDPQNSVSELNQLSVNTDSLPRIWQDILANVGQLLGSELEKGGLPAISGPNGLVLRFSGEYDRPYAFCSDPVRVQRVQDAVRRLTGADWTFRVELNYGRNGSSERPGETSSEGNSSRTSIRTKSDVLRQPLIERIVAALGGQLVTVDENFGELVSSTIGETPSQPVEVEET